MREKLIYIVVTFCLAASFTLPGFVSAEEMTMEQTNKGYEKATFAGGCFWCMEPPFDKLDGVISTTSGYTGGMEENPTYKQVSSGRTGHTEAVQIVYDPASPLLKQRVKFLNDEKKEISHNVYFLGDVEADLGIFQQGESREHDFDGAGEVSVHCSIHKRMDAKFFVAPNPAFAVLKAGATSFKIKGVPVGRYTLRTWQKQKRFKDFRITVDVTDGGTTPVTVKMAR